MTATYGLGPADRIDVAARRVPPLGGFNLTLLSIEIRRLLRNRRTMIFSVGFPILFYFIFRNANGFIAGDDSNTAAWIAISLGLYGAFMATASTSAGVSIERAQGWSRQLRLTPLSGSAYIATKILVSMALGLIPLVVLYALSLGLGAHSTAAVMIPAFFISWFGSMLLAAMGLVIGYLLPGENAMQVLGILMTLLAFGGGVFIPQPLFGHTFDLFARWTPEYGVCGLAHAPMTGDWSDLWIWLLNIVGWGVVLTGLAVWLFRRDTKRV